MRISELRLSVCATCLLHFQCSENLRSQLVLLSLILNSGCPWSIFVMSDKSQKHITIKTGQLPSYFMYLLCPSIQI